MVWRIVNRSRSYGLIITVRLKTLLSNGYSIFLFNCLICNFYIFLNCSIIQNEKRIYRISSFFIQILISLKCIKPSLPNSYKSLCSITPKLVRNLLIISLWFLMLLIINIEVGMYWTFSDKSRWKIWDYISHMVLMLCNTLVYTIFFKAGNTSICIISITYKSMIHNVNAYNYHW